MPNKEDKKHQTDCQDLRNIQYKTMLMNGPKHTIAPKGIGSTTDIVEQFLETEKKEHKNITWSRLDRSSRIKKLYEYAEKYASEKSISKAELVKLKGYLLECLNKKKLMRARDVKYDKEKEIIEDIPRLNFNKSTRKFTLKRSEKRTSTLSSLGPGNTRKLKPPKNGKKPLKSLKKSTKNNKIE